MSGGPTSTPARWRLDGQLALVTGGGGGIGSSICATLAAAGATVVVADQSLESATRVCAAIAAQGFDAQAIVLDVTDESSVSGAFTSLRQLTGPVRVLVNCAGITLRAPALEHALDAWNRVFATNVTGTFLCARAAARQMMEAGGGAIINIASIRGVSGGGLYPNISYQTSKGAVINMTRALALEWASNDIRVNAIAPTYVHTEFIRAITDDPALLERIRAMTPLRRLAEPQEIADAALYLATGASAMVTGHVLAVDGGFLAQ
ncbi:MAG: glucose 1-dehydrogenase [Burkholderiales bacterium]|nr:glucose 1-dehydrogenase [Burkholderiales bacterium]